MGDKLTLMPTWNPAQALSIIEAASMKQVKVARKGDLVLIHLNVLHPEDIQIGNFLVKREQADDLVLSKNLKVEVELTSNAYADHRLISSGY